MSTKERAINSDFFISSRRRHTNSVSTFLLNRSSDLSWRLFYGSFLLPFKIISVTFRRVIRTNHKKASKIWRHENRSEERRVGKECRKCRSLHDEKKRMNGDGMKIIRNDISNKQNRSRKAMVY